MARQTKKATVARLEVVPEPPAFEHPAGGYSDDEFAEAIEIVRHQALVLKIRSRVAALSAGLPLTLAEPTQRHEPVSLLKVRRDAREIELEEATAALRDAQAALARRGSDLSVREEVLAAGVVAGVAARAELEEAVARLAEERVAAAEQLAVLERRSLELEELGVREQASAAAERELQARAGVLESGEVALRDADVDLKRREEELARAQADLAGERGRLDVGVAALEQEAKELGGLGSDLSVREEVLAAGVVAGVAARAELEEAVARLAEERVAAAEQLAVLERRSLELEELGVREQASAAAERELQARAGVLESGEVALRDADVDLKRREEELARAQADLAGERGRLDVGVAALEQEAKELGGLGSDLSVREEVLAAGVVRVLRRGLSLRRRLRGLRRGGWLRLSSWRCSSGVRWSWRSWVCVSRLRLRLSVSCRLGQVCWSPARWRCAMRTWI